MTTYVQNKKVRFDFELLEEFEAGIILTGSEVKAIRNSKAKLDGAYVVIRGDEAFLVSASIAPYQEKNTPTDYEPGAARKLLLSKKELARLHTASEKNGLTIVPLRWYSGGRHVKLAIAIARGKKKQDKRESLKARDTKRDIDRILKTQY